MFAALKYPLATYRLQLQPAFTFKDALRVAPYVRRLGADALYLSPIFQARAGSTHGYDVQDFGRINPELGGRKGFELLARGCRRLGLKIILDMVPNHMGIVGRGNALWWDVLRRGPGSYAARYFDIDWSPLKKELRNKVLLPILAGPYGEALRKGHFKIKKRGTGAVLRYFDHEIPLRTRPRGTPRGPEALHALLEKQFYRLASWRTASDEINYRRFFDINELAAIKAEDPKVFEQTHILLRDFAKSGKIHGLRIDHPDGLYDPAQYFRRLAGAGFRYVVAEKVLEPGEILPADWPVQGTVGYDFLSGLDPLFVKGRNARAFDRIYASFTGRRWDFDALLYESKKFIALVHMSGEVAHLAARLNRLSETDTMARDFTYNTLTVALRELLASFPVYRTYIGSAGLEALPRDRKYVAEAVRKAKQRTPALTHAAYDYIRDVLLLERVAGAGERPGFRQLDFVKRFSQLTGPVMAKGMEDTAFYVYNRLVSLNEVGGDPRRFGIPVREFHAMNRHRAARWPAGMLASSTHDTKRGEDARMRIHVLSEMPAEWERRLRKWSRINARHKRAVAGAGVPCRNVEYLFYQNLLGIAGTNADGQALRDRMRGYMQKAVREAKVHTNWINPNGAYEEAVDGFVRDVMGAGRASPFWRDFCRFSDRVDRLARCNSISALALKLGSPGVADIYQGAEFLHSVLVDPDNRRPVDFRVRAGMLKVLERLEAKTEGARMARRLFASADGNASKMHMLHRGLMLRRQYPEVFVGGEYIPLVVRGKQRERVIAFARKRGKDVVLVVAGRYFFGMLPPKAKAVPAHRWADTTVTLPAKILYTRRFYDVCTGRWLGSARGRGALRLKVRELLRDLPAAVLKS